MAFDEETAWSSSRQPSDSFRSDRFAEPEREADASRYWDPPTDFQNEPQFMGDSNRYGSKAYFSEYPPYGSERRPENRLPENLKESYDPNLINTPTPYRENVMRYPNDNENISDGYERTLPAGSTRPSYADREQRYPPQERADPYFNDSSALNDDRRSNRWQNSPPYSSNQDRFLAEESAYPQRYRTRAAQRNDLNRYGNQGYDSAWPEEESPYYNATPSYSRSQEMNLPPHHDYNGPNDRYDDPRHQRFSNDTQYSVPQWPAARDRYTSPEDAPTGLPTGYLSPGRASGHPFNPWR